MVLNEVDLARLLMRGHKDAGLIVTPLVNAEKQLGSNSIDLRLGSNFKVVRHIRYTHLDPIDTNERTIRSVARYTEEIYLEPLSAFILHPGTFALGNTLEHVRVPHSYCGRLEGRSGLGRMGLQIHSTAGFIDAGFSGTITLELQNVGKVPIPLFPGVRVAQLSLHESEPTTRPYAKSGRYSGYEGAMGSLFFTEPEYEVLRIVETDRRHARMARRLVSLTAGDRMQLAKILGQDEPELEQVMAFMAKERIRRVGIGEDDQEDADSVLLDDSDDASGKA